MGWGLNWLPHGLFLNALFFNQSGFSSFGGGYASGFGVSSDGVTAWAHNPVHRLGVSYASRTAASRFSGSYQGDRLAGYAGNRSAAATPQGGWRTFGGRSPAASAGGAGSRGAWPSQSEGWRAPSGRRAQPKECTSAIIEAECRHAEDTSPAIIFRTALRPDLNIARRVYPRWDRLSFGERLIRVRPELSRGLRPFQLLQSSAPVLRIDFTPAALLHKGLLRTALVASRALFDAEVARL